MYTKGTLFQKMIRKSTSAMGWSSLVEFHKYNLPLNEILMVQLSLSVLNQQEQHRTLSKNLQTVVGSAHIP